MSTDQSQPSVQTSLNFDKFKDYFDRSFNELQSPSEDSSTIKELRNKLQAKELSRPDNVEQFEFCGKLEILVGKSKLALTDRPDLDSAVQALDEALELIADRKRKIRIADGSKAGWATITHLNKRGNEDLGISSDQLKSIKIAEEEALKEQQDRKRRRQDGPDPVPKDSSDRRLFRGRPTHNSLCYFMLRHCACKPTIALSE